MFLSFNMKAITVATKTGATKMSRVHSREWLAVGSGEDSMPPARTIPNTQNRSIPAMQSRNGRFERAPSLRLPATAAEGAPSFRSSNAPSKGSIAYGNVAMNGSKKLSAK